MSKPKAVEPTPVTSTSTTPGGTYTWEALAQTVAEPTKEQLALFAIRTAPAELVERGTHIRSEKILTDMVRLCGVAAEFYSRATEDQRFLLLGFSPALLSVTVHSGLKLKNMLENRGSTIEDREANLAADTTTAETTYQEGMRARDRLATALESAADGDATFETRIDAARGKIVDHASLASSLSSLEKLGRHLILDQASQAGKQLLEGGLTEAVLDKTKALAAKVKSSGASATGARTKGVVAQGDIDLQDGICLAYLERMMKIWNGAHDSDPSIPALYPIAARRMFTPARKKPADPTAKAAEPATEPAAKAATEPAPAVAAEKNPS